MIAIVTCWIWELIQYFSKIQREQFSQDACLFIGRNNLKETILCYTLGKMCGEREIYAHLNFGKTYFSISYGKNFRSLKV